MARRGERWYARRGPSATAQAIRQLACAVRGARPCISSGEREGGSGVAFRLLRAGALRGPSSGAGWSSGEKCPGIASPATCSRKVRPPTLPDSSHGPGRKRIEGFHCSGVWPLVLVAGVVDARQRQDDGGGRAEGSTTEGLGLELLRRAAADRSQGALPRREHSRLPRRTAW